MSGAILFMIPKDYLTGVNSRIAVSFLLLEPPLPLTRPRIGCESGRLYRRRSPQTARRGGGAGVRTGHCGSDRKSLSALFLVEAFTTASYPTGQAVVGLVSGKERKMRGSPFFGQLKRGKKRECFGTVTAARFRFMLFSGRCCREFWGAAQSTNGREPI